VSTTTEAAAEIEPDAPGAGKPNIAFAPVPELTTSTIEPPFSSSAVADA
jgi:hypothetical protein